ncbi:6-phosphofructokinase [Metabacillus rhizolycopersici]|uniref:6-phosphofructokinase n=1 Tax=Metabacillus rhizolycopersici TaxID=2875709 RepID=UPI0021E1A859|nr:6-phosphofructokinase [Metabacillus rhizolycopersici]
MNTAIRAVVKAANYHHLDVMGIQGGYQGLIDGKIHPLTFSEIEDSTDRGGTTLKPSRSSEFMEEAEKKDTRGIKKL